MGDPEPHRPGVEKDVADGLAGGGPRDAEGHAHRRDVPLVREKLDRDLVGIDGGGAGSSASAPSAAGNPRKKEDEGQKRHPGKKAAKEVVKRPVCPSLGPPWRSTVRDWGWGEGTVQIGGS